MEGVIRNQTKSQFSGNLLCRRVVCTAECGRSRKERKKGKQSFYWKKGGNDNITQMMVSVYEAAANRDQERQLRILVLLFPHCVRAHHLTSLFLSIIFNNRVIMTLK